MAQRVKVHQTVDIAERIRQLSLEPVDSEELPEWRPGAHVDLKLPSGVVRQYSLCGYPEQREHFTLAVLLERDGRGGSAEVHSLQPGDELQITAVRNHFPFRPSPRYLFIAGGIGITPLLTMVEQAAREGREWHLVYGARSRANMAYLERLAELNGSVELVPEDSHGRPNLTEILTPTNDTLVYCCGPDPLISAVENEYARRWPPGHLEIERFTTTSPDHEPHSDNQPVEVQIGTNGPIIQVGANQSVLDALIEAGIDMMYSCTEGTCGTCETTVIDGNVDHRDNLLSAEERKCGSMLVCVSRALGSRLVLDIDQPD